MVNPGTSIFFMIILCGTTLAQDPYFTVANTNLPIGATIVNSMDVETADVDSDGDLDLVIAGEYSRNLLFFNDGSGVFAEDPNKLFPEKNTGDPFTGEDSEDIAFADFDLDGDLDIIFVSEDTSFHELLVNDGSGAFTFIGYDFPASAGNAVAVLDLNNDNYPDVIIGNTGQNDVFINNQDLTFTQENNRWPLNTEGTQDLKLIDLDNDGDLDILEGIDLGSNNALINVNGFFSEENNRLPNTGLLLETRKISLGDVNGDTFDDIFISTVNFATTGDLQNRLYLNNGNGFFTDATTTHLPAYSQRTLDGIFLDYDQDGDMDLITTDFQNPVTSYHAFENDGTGVFSEVTNTVFEAFSFTNGVGLHAADLNGDTYKDLYFSNFQETDDLLFFSEDALAVSDISRIDGIELIPNPILNFMWIHSSGIEIQQLEIFTLDGRLVRSTSLEENRLDLTELASGSYLVRFYTREGSITKRILKN